MKIEATVDSADWSAALNRLVLLCHDAGVEASLQAAEEIRDIARGKLAKRQHGEFTYSPSGPGQAPAMVYGDLFASMHAERVDDQGWVGPTGGYGRTEHYARIQELGGDMHGHPLMRFRKFGPDGLLHEITREFVHLYPRPYLEPSTEDLINSGRLTDIYIGHWTAAIEEVA